MEMQNSVRTLFVIIMLLLSAHTIWGASFNQEKELRTDLRALGDINKDGKINETDLKVFREKLESNETENLSEQVYDLNSDGSVNKKDPEALEKFLEGEIKKFKACPHFVDISFDKNKYSSEEFILGKISVQDYYGDPLRVNAHLSVYKNNQLLSDRKIEIEGEEKQLGEFHERANISYTLKTPDFISCPSVMDSVNIRVIETETKFEIVNITRNIAILKNTGEDNLKLNVSAFYKDRLFSNKIINLKKKTMRALRFEKNVTKIKADAVNFHLFKSKELVENSAGLEIRKREKRSVEVENTGVISLLVVLKVYHKGNIVGLERFRVEPGKIRKFDYEVGIDQGTVKALNLEKKIKDSFQGGKTSINDSKSNKSNKKSLNNSEKSESQQNNEEKNENLFRNFLEFLKSLFEGLMGFLGLK